MSIKKRKKSIQILTIVVALFFLAFPAHVNADINKRKIINVVYDDSTSMLWNSETRWCLAKYALEVFVAMMGEQDVLNVHAMNREEVLTLTGNDRDRVSKVHAMNSMYGDTPLQTVIQAGDALLREDPSAERWLVILTDGQFYDDDLVTPLSTERVQATIDSYNDQGIKSVYLGIGNDAAQLRNDARRYSYAEKAAYTSEILTKVTSIANQIFDHQVLPQNHISNQGKTRTLDIDIPTSQLIVFAQGENASVGSMKLNGNEIRNTSKWVVRHSGDVMPLNTDYNIAVDTSLHGVLAVFEAGSSSFEPGKYEVEVSGETQVEYYYRPSVQVNCELYQGSNVVPPNSVGIASGTYDVRMNFVHPLTGEIIDSELLNADFQMTALNNGTEQVINGTSGTVTLENGEVIISASATLPGNVILSNQKNYSVMRGLNIEVEGNPGTYTQDDFISSDVSPIIIRITDDQTGEELSQEALNNIELLIDSGQKKDDLDWTCKYNNDGTWSLIPKSRNGKMKNIKTGDRKIGVSASFTAGNDSGAGNIEIPISIGAYEGSQLNIEVSPGGSYELKDYLKGDYMTINVTYRNPDNGQQEALTEKMSKNLKLRATATRQGGKKARLDWDIKQGEEPGVFLIKPRPYLRILTLLTSSGNCDLNLSGEVKNGEYIYSGTGSQQVTIVALPLMHIAIRVALLIAVILLIISYITKPRIKTFGKNFCPTCTKYQNGVPVVYSGRRKIKKKLSSVLLPRVPERAYVYSGDSTYGCRCGNMEIIAYTNSQFQILSDMPVQRIRINGKSFKDNKELKKMIFGYGSFKIDSIDKRSMIEGRFTFRKPNQTKKKTRNSKRDSLKRKYGGKKS